MKKFALSLALAMGAAVAGAAVADESKFSGYGTVEGWNIFVDHEKKSCLIEKKDDLENVVQMGLTEDRAVAYIGVFTKAETEIKNGQKDAIAILLGDNLYLGEATGMRGGITKGYTGGYILTDNPQVIEDVARQHVMVVFPETAYTFAVNLDGTFKALEAAKKCNEEQM